MVVEDQWTVRNRAHLRTDTKGLATTSRLRLETKFFGHFVSTVRENCSVALATVPATSIYLFSFFLSFFLSSSSLKLEYKGNTWILLLLLLFLLLPKVNKFQDDLIHKRFSTTHLFVRFF